MSFVGALEKVLKIQERDLFRKNAKVTSIEAAQSIFPKLRELHIEILSYAIDRGYNGFTDIDMNRHFETEMSTYRARRSELERAGLIVDTGRRVKYPERGNNRSHTVFVAKEFHIENG
jgi:hypothetical protein